MGTIGYAIMDISMDSYRVYGSYPELSPTYDEAAAAIEQVDDVGEFVVAEVLVEPGWEYIQ